MDMAFQLDLPDMVELEDSILGLVLRRESVDGWANREV
jgi:hypothetical protein